MIECVTSTIAKPIPSNAWNRPSVGKSTDESVRGTAALHEVSDNKRDKDETHDDVDRQDELERQRRDGGRDETDVHQPSTRMS